MPVISFASSKGGAGKTTSAIILGTTLGRTHNVIIIDADPAKRLKSWADKGKLPPRLSVHVSQGERFIHDEIDAARERAEFVILDLEGAGTRLNAYCMGESDLVIIPMGDEQPDAEGAIETFAQLSLETRNMRREIPVKVLFAKTKAAVKSRLAKSLNQQVREKLGSFQVELSERTAFSSLHHYGGTLYSLDPEEVGGLSKAIGNAELFAEEVLSSLNWVKKVQDIKHANISEGK